MTTEIVDDGPDETNEYQPMTGRGKFIDNYAWLVLGVLTVAGFAAVWTLLPHAREGQTLGQMAIKIAVFVGAILSVALMPRLRRTGFLVASAPFLVFLGYVIPRGTYYFLHGPQTEPDYYTVLWSLLYPGIMLSICLAWRQGGGSVGRTVKIGLFGVVLVFSGYLEWMWFRANSDMDYYDMKTIPHIEALIGFVPSYAGLFVFMLCHVPLFVAIGLAPLDRWLDRLRGGGSVAVPDRRRAP